MGRAVDDGWLDAEPRAGKVGGAFCMSVQGEVSRVLLNFDGSFDSVQTLAHELGHAYHNTNLGHRTPLQRQTPMALAETASIFCETIMVQAGLAAAGGDDGARLAILDGELLHPYMWAAKPHYYSSTFYNWPYTFGLLFGLGLYAQFQRDPDRFRLGYDDLLSATGLGEADELAARFGIDVRSVDFWTASLDVLRDRIDDFVRLAAA